MCGCKSAGCRAGKEADCVDDERNLEYTLDINTRKDAVVRG